MLERLVAIQESPCGICGSTDEEGEHNTMILCDVCDKSYHLRCLQPPLKAVPEGDWTCQSCLTGPPAAETSDMKTEVTDAATAEGGQRATPAAVGEEAPAAGAGAPEAVADAPAAPEAGAAQVGAGGGQVATPVEPPVPPPVEAPAAPPAVSEGGSQTDPVKAKKRPRNYGDDTVSLASHETAECGRFCLMVGEAAGLVRRCFIEYVEAQTAEATREQLQDPQYQAQLACRLRNSRRAWATLVFRSMLASYTRSSLYKRTRANRASGPRTVNASSGFLTPTAAASGASPVPTS